MTAPQPYAGLTIADLRRAPAPHLDPLLDQQVEAWSRLLSWDFEPSANLVRRYVAMRALSGCVLYDGARPAGYAYYVVEEHKALIGDLFLADPWRLVDNENYLLGATVEAAYQDSGIRRIESQPMLLLPAIQRTFPTRLPPRPHPRQFMSLRLGDRRWIGGPPRASGLALGPWQETMASAAARLIAAAYDGHIDAQINDQYRSDAGANRFLHNIIHYPGCGRFSTPASVAARDKSGRLAGISLASLIGPSAGHITQICVHPDWRGYGLGRDLLTASIAALSEEGCRTVSLTVTSANHSAIQLYERMGFQVLRRFPAFVWEF